MVKIRNLPLWVKTIIISIIIHGVAISLIPGFINESTSKLTVRDIKFFIEHILPSEESSLAGKNPLKELPKLITLPLPKPKLSNTNSDLGVSANIPSLDTRLTAVGQAGTLSAQLDTTPHIPPEPKPKVKITKKPKQLTLAEAQKILKRLEKEISLKEISSRGENKRTYSPRYLDQVRERIKAQYFVPDRAKWEKMKGTVVLQVTVSAQGKIKNITFVNHSDFPILDMAARGMVEHAAPFPNIKHLVDFKELKFIVPIRY